MLWVLIRMALTEYTVIVVFAVETNPIIIIKIPTLSVSLCKEEIVRNSNLTGKGRIRQKTIPFKVGCPRLSSRMSVTVSKMLEVLDLRRMNHSRALAWP